MMQAEEQKPIVQL